MSFQPNDYGLDLCSDYGVFAFIIEVNVYATWVHALHYAVESAMCVHVKHTFQKKYTDPANDKKTEQSF